jgi:hypothetical protein
VFVIGDRVLDVRDKSIADLAVGRNDRKQTGKNFLKPDSGKCLRYYFYFTDAELG